MGTGDRIFLWAVLMIFFLLTWLKYIEKHIPLYGLIPIGIILAVILARAFRPSRETGPSGKQDEESSEIRNVR